MAPSPALEQMPTGRLYAALLARLENDKAELERERDFLKKELAVQAFRNRKLEKAMEELKRAAQERAQGQGPVVNSCNSESEYSESDTADTELERTPAASPEMRAVTIPPQPVPVLPLCTAIAEDSIPERCAGPSHGTGGVVPQPQPIGEDGDISGGDGDIITNWTPYWREWEEAGGGFFCRRGKLVVLPGGVITTFGLMRGGKKIWLIKAHLPPGEGYSEGGPRLILLNYRCRIKCECGSRCARGTDAMIKRLTIVGDEMHLDGAD